MEKSLGRLVDSFAGLRVLVVGDAILDGYFEGTTGRLCREAPVPVVRVETRKHEPGGAANAAANCRSLGAEVDFVSVLGRDWEGRLLRAALRRCGVHDRHLLAQRNRQTMAKLRVVADGQMLVRFDDGSDEPLDEGTRDAIVARLEEAYPKADAVIVSDYGNGLFQPRLIDALADLQRRTPRVLAVDSRNRLPAFKKLGATIVKPNFREVAAFLPPDALPEAHNRADAIAACADDILDRTGSRMAAVTLDHEGAILLRRGAEPYRTYAEPRPESRAAGAGDSFMSALVLALAAGVSPSGAAEIAAAAASIVVGHDGTTRCSAGELRERLLGSGKIVEDASRLLALVQAHRSHGAKIVFTNGCFDILHRGHIAYLNEAKSLGNLLIVGVNSDASVTRLKGPGRPVNPLDDRLQVLAAVNCVDYVVAFDEDTSARLVAAIRPDVFTKGGNYTRDRLPEAAMVESLGGEVRVLTHLGDRSTTRIIERVRSGYVGDWAAGSGTAARHSDRGGSSAAIPQAEQSHRDGRNRGGKG